MYFCSLLLRYKTLFLLFYLIFNAYCLFKLQGGLIGLAAVTVGLTKEAAQYLEV